MKCPKCQTENPDTRKFCRECGIKLNLICTQCSAENLPNDKFCGECGVNLKASEEVSAIDYSKPQSYTPKFLADKILTTRSTIEGERKLVTVLFADVANFTAMAEKLDPEIVHQIMDGCFNILMIETHRYEGTINQFTGDGIMALFGAPLAHEDHAQRACHAALFIQRSITKYGEKITTDFGIDFKMRIGINSGPVVVGAIGDDLRMDYTAVGDTTNLATRMETMARPGSVIVSENTQRLVKDYFELNPLCPVQVKGKEQPQSAFELMKSSQVETRLDASISRGLTRFVGRKDSMSTITDRWENVLSGSGQILGIVGDAGVGKSRFLLEFRNSLDTREFSYLEGRCLPYGGSIAYLPFLDILKGYFEIKENEPEYAITTKLKGKLAKFNPGLLDIALPAFQDLLSLKVDDEIWSELEPKEKREQTFEALRNLLIEIGLNKPLVLAIEDLHWIDKSSEKFLNYFIDWLPQSSILLILLYRPEYIHSWSNKSYFSKVGLNQLTTESSAELVLALLKGGEVALELEQLILSRAAGNPLFMEEFTQSLLEDGLITRQEGNRFVLNRKSTEIQVPATIQGIIAARMDRLEDNLKRTMQVASVIGRDFAFRILQTITGMREELKSHLLNLQGLEFIYEKRLFPELEYIFKHALTQEVAYNSLLLKRRKELHEKIGRAIEEIYLERLEEFYEMLAYHYFEGEIWSKALDYLTKAADKAAAAYANQEALGYYARSLEVCDKLETPALKACVDLARKRGVVNCTIGDYREAIEDFDRMCAAACKIADRHLEGTALAYRGFAEHQNHMVGTPEDTLRSALAIADEGFADVRFRANACLGGHFLVYNRHSEALPLLREASELAHQVDDALIQGWWVLFESFLPNWQGRFEDALKVQAKWHNATRRGRVSFLVNTFVEALARGGKGQYEQAMACLNEILTIGERMGEVFWLARALNTMGWLYSELEDHHRAMTWNTQGIEVARKANFPIPEAESNARLNLGDNFLALGRLDEAGEQFQHVEQIVRNPRPQDHFMLWRYSQHLFHSYGELWFIRGDLDKAMDYADECVTLAQQSNSLKNIVKGRRLKGQVFLAQGMLAAAEQEFSRALKVALQVGNPTQLWMTYSALARMNEGMKRQELEQDNWKAAAVIVKSVTDRLQEEELRQTFIDAAPVQEIIKRASRIRGKNEQ